MQPNNFLADCLTFDNDYVKFTRQRSDETKAKIAVYKGEQRFSLEMFKVLTELQKDQNICFCPYSIHQMLLMSFIIASYGTEDCLRRALHFEPDQSKLTTVELYLRDKCTHKMRLMNGAPCFEFSVAVKMFIKKDIKTRDIVVKLLRDELEPLDFKTDPNSAREHINKWVEKTTKGQIKDLLSKNVINEDCEFLIVSGAYFKGFWKYKFLPQNTNKNSFYVSPDDAKVMDFMTQKGVFNCKTSEKLKAQILEMPYIENELSMFIMLPDTESNVAELISRLPDVSFEELIKFESPNIRQVELEFPKFSMEQTIDLQPAFTSLGLKELYEQQGEFATLTFTFSSIHWTSTIHKSKIEVSEEGGVKVDDDGVVEEEKIEWDPSAETIKFVANRPFVYMVYDKMSLNILYLGVLKGLD